MHAHTLTIADIFDSPFEHVEPLSIADEVALIAGAKEGDEDAKTALLRQYIPALRGILANERRLNNGKAEEDELRATTLLTFAEAVAAIEPGRRLADKLNRKSARDVAVEWLRSRDAIDVPYRTRRRFLALLRDAGGDIRRAAELNAALPAQTRLSDETFAAVREAIADWTSIEGTTDALRERLSQGTVGAGGALHDVEPAMYRLSGLDRGFATVDQAEEVEAAFDSIDEKETAVIRLAYAFDEYEPVPDAEIAHRIGASRSAVQRTRTTALTKMHAHICDGDDPRCQRAEEHAA